MTPIIKVQDLTKHYRNIKAVNGISFGIPAGVCLGLLGPNGAGKTTTIEMLEGICFPTGGEILYKGRALGRRFREEAGIMFQSTALQELITVRETLTLFQRLYPKTLPIAEVVELCALHEFIDRDTHKLSGGQKQRVLLAISLINNPEVVFLDEPTTGLDPQSRHQFWKLVKHIKEQGKTIILTTHYMEEAYRLCDEVAIMDHGKIITIGTPKDLLATQFNDVIVQLPITTTLMKKDLSAFSARQRNDVVELRTDDVTHTMAQLLRLDISLQGLHIRERTLEDLFLELTGKALRQ